MLLIRHGQSHFNAVFSVTRVDPGIPDPELTDEGRRQIQETARLLAGRRARGETELRRLISSPYTRALQTATIIAEELGLEVTIDPLVRERAAFHCDIGTKVADLQQRFPKYQFDHLADPWWHDHVTQGIAETEDAIAERAAAFKASLANAADWRHVGVVTHWGFIRSLTGLRSLNGEVVPVSLA
jgi:broad specificity phosphatase PhoE